MIISYTFKHIPIWRQILNMLVLHCRNVFNLMLKRKTYIIRTIIPRSNEQIPIATKNTKIQKDSRSLRE